MKIKYKHRRFAGKTQRIIVQANQILEEYAEQGFVLTLRQLYYQFVARGLIENTERSYKNLGATISGARLAGLIDWSYLIDSTRFLRGKNHWDHPSEIIKDTVHSYNLDLWEGQIIRPEIWIEKDALVDVALQAGSPFDVPVFSCRGYGSQSELWAASRRLSHHAETPVIFHLGDHDPSGIDMTRDIVERFKMFGVHDLELYRLALNMDQIEEYQPPPNPAKVTDTRFKEYCVRYGSESWELDALEPNVIVELIRSNLENRINKRRWKRRERMQKADRETLDLIAQNYDAFKEFLDYNEFYNKYGFDPNDLFKPNDYY